MADMKLAQDYVAEMQKAVAAVRAAMKIDAGALAQVLDHADAFGWVTDPTAYRNALGDGRLDDQRSIISAVIALQGVVAKSEKLSTLFRLEAIVRSRGGILDEVDEAKQLDEAGVDRFAGAMKTRLADKREEGFSGWEGDECTDDLLWERLEEQVEDRDPVDIANFAMMIFVRGMARLEREQRKDG